MADLSFKVRADGTSELEKVRDKFHSVKRDLGKGITVGVGVKLAELGQGALAGIKDKIGEGLKTAIQQEDFQVAFQQFTGSVENAISLTEKLNALSVKTPFTGGEVMGAAKSLLSAGVEWNTAFESIEQLSNVADSGEVLQALATALGKGFAKGKFQTKELNQFIERGVNLYPALAKAMQVPETELSKLIEKGVTFQQVMAGIGALTGKGGQFEGFAERKSQSTSGLMSTIGGGIEEANKELFTPLLQSVQPVLKLMADNMGKVVGVAKNLGGYLAKLAPIMAPFVALWGASKIQGAISGAVKLVQSFTTATRGAAAATAEVGQAATAAQGKLGRLKLGSAIGGAATMGASVAGGMVADYFYGQADAYDKASASFQRTAAAVQDVVAEFGVGESKVADMFGSSSEVAAKMEEIEQAIEGVRKEKAAAEEELSGVDATTRGSALAGYDTWITQLERVKEAMHGVTSGQMERVRLQREELRLAEEAELKNAELAKAWDQTQKDYNARKEQRAAEEAMGGSGQVAKDWLTQKQVSLLGSYSSRAEMEAAAEYMAGGETESSKAAATDLLKRAKELLEVEKNMKRLEEQKEEADRKIEEDYAEQVELVRLEASGNEEAVRQKEKELAIRKQINELIKSGMSMEEATRKATDFQNAKFAAEDAKKQAEEKRQKADEKAENRKNLMADLTDKEREAWAKQSKNSMADMALQVVRRSEELQNNYGVSAGKARRRAMREALSMDGGQQGINMGAVSALQSIGGGGAFNAAQNTEPKKQTELLEKAVEELEKLNGSGVGLL